MQEESPPFWRALLLHGASRQKNWAAALPQPSKSELFRLLLLPDPDLAGFLGRSRLLGGRGLALRIGQPLTGSQLRIHRSEDLLLSIAAVVEDRAVNLVAKHVEVLEVRHRELLAVRRVLVAVLGEIEVARNPQ